MGTRIGELKRLVREVFDAESNLPEELQVLRDGMREAGMRPFATDNALWPTQIAQACGLPDPHVKRLALHAWQKIDVPGHLATAIQQVCESKACTNLAVDLVDTVVRPQLQRLSIPADAQDIDDLVVEWLHNVRSNPHIEGVYYDRIDEYMGSVGAWGIMQWLHSILQHSVTPFFLVFTVDALLSGNPGASEEEGGMYVPPAPQELVSLILRFVPDPSKA